MKCWTTSFNNRRFRSRSGTTAFAVNSARLFAVTYNAFGDGTSDENAAILPVKVVVDIVVVVAVAVVVVVAAVVVSLAMMDKLLVVVFAAIGPASESLDGLAVKFERSFEETDRDDEFDLKLEYEWFIGEINSGAETFVDLGETGIGFLSIDDDTMSLARERKPKSSITRQSSK